MATRNRQKGFTLIEVVIVVAIVGALAALGAIAMESWFANARVKGKARNFADLLLLARTEAIRTGDTHLVFFYEDASDNALNDSGPVAALVARDANGDGTPQSSENVASVKIDSTGDVMWGAAFALASGSEVPAPNDNPAASYPLSSDFRCCSFTTPGGAEARWVAFAPDGTPRAFSIGPFALGGVTTGNGTVYITDGDRDYAVVLNSLGGVRVHAFQPGGAAWRK